MNIPTFPNRRAQVAYSAAVALALGVVVGGMIAAYLIGRYHAEQEQTARCAYLGRLLAAELNQPAAQEIITARCLQAK